MFSVHTCPLATLGGKETGGMNVYVRELTREFGRRGLPVDVFTRAQRPDHLRICPLGDHGRVIHITAGQRGPYDKNDLYDHVPQFVEGVRRFAQEEGLSYDILHSHYWLSALVARELRQAWGAPIVHMAHTWGEMKNRVAQSPAEFESPRRLASEREIVGFVDRLVAATDRETQQMQEYYGADPARVSVVPPGVDLERFRPLPCPEARAAIGVPRDHLMILFVGRIQPIKGIDTLMQALALLLQRQPALRPRLCVSLIGGDPDPDSEHERSEMARLTALRESLGIGDLVTFLGSKDQDTLVHYYSAASMVVMPSHYESFGMVALEAMACGTPVIASDVGGLSFSVAHNFSGYLVPAGNPDALAEKIALLLEDGELRRRLSRQARHWAQQYGWGSIADRILEVYRTTLAGAAIPCLRPCSCG
ncbi:MAG: glycosyltransferase family 1 protein [Chloroflexi bacterium]|nr:glycosyltransferase family 1 protein [Chloroflexota bacterium]